MGDWSEIGGHQVAREVADERGVRPSNPSRGARRFSVLCDVDEGWRHLPYG